MNTAIDAHVHIWNRARGETFIAEKQFPALTGKAFLPEDLMPVLAATGAGSAVLVHGPATVAHAHYCLELCHRYEMFRSVVGWVDLRDPDCLSQLAGQAGDTAFRGVRFTPLLDADPRGYLRSDAALSICSALQAQGHLVEVLAPQALLRSVAALALAFPKLPVVLAHFGLPDGNPDGFGAWRQSMSHLSRHYNVHVKLSGLPLTGDADRDRKMARDHVLPLLDCFGPHRLIYASNWPVATALAKPEYWRDLLQATLQEASLDEVRQAAIWRGNTERLY
ncbi:amidohydrolase family protein [Nitratireductor kimnyeongensis]|uniref:Amidohydrolase family protein n=1 Tax=Nitratireductor kimnyeongensis TaxID=430679 RepID=A0ABW0T8B7_9HYPH|nr:amidohydrolase family protein [Nitratireductor kimnyeongensis]QZZ34034.1 amidohydrolase [Nitratireductor kimnyeongensis]